MLNLELDGFYCSRQLSQLFLFSVVFSPSPLSRQSLVLRHLSTLSYTVSPVQAFLKKEDDRGSLSIQSSLVLEDKIKIFTATFHTCPHTSFLGAAT
jgi:hypothetical protein